MKQDWISVEGRPPLRVCIQLRLHDLNPDLGTRPLPRHLVWWLFSVVIVRWSRLTKLLYAGLGLYWDWWPVRSAYLQTLPKYTAPVNPNVWLAGNRSSKTSITRS